MKEIKILDRGYNNLNDIFVLWKVHINITQNAFFSQL